jgi:hypothetical protein
MKTTISPVTIGHPCRHHSESPADIASEQAADIAGIRTHPPGRVCWDPGWRRAVLFGGLAVVLIPTLPASRGFPTMPLHGRHGRSC